VLRLRILPASALVLALVMTAAAQEKKDAPTTDKKDALTTDKKGGEAGSGAPSAFAWKFEKDKPFFQEMTTTTTQSMKVQGMDVNQVQKQTFYFKWTPLKQDGDKWLLKQTIEGVKMSIDIAGNPISFDSTNPTAGGTNTALSEFFKALVGSEFQITLNPKTMKVEKVEGREEFLKKLASANQQMEGLLKKILSDEALKQMADPTFGVTPTETKKPGETWQNKVTLNLGPIGSYENTYTYTYKGKDEKSPKLEKIEVQVDLVYKAPTGEPEGLPFKIKSADLKTKDKSPGTILFNTETGRVESMELSQKLGGTLTIEIGGNTSTVELQQEQATSVKTSDKTFLAEKK
jgi:Family of unknown function (DUF6263)